MEGREREGFTKSRPSRLEIHVDAFSLVIETPDDPDAVVRDSEARGAAENGYWAHVWPSARALAEHVARSPLLAAVEGGFPMHIIEIGAGAGLVGLFAAARGARVILSDGRPEAVELARRNISLNALEHRATAELFDWNTPPPDHWRPDLLLASDVLYHESAHGPIARLVRSLHCPAFISDPNRPAASAARAVFEQHGLRVWESRGEGCRMFMVQPGG